MFWACVKFLIIDLEAPLFVWVAEGGRGFVTHLGGGFYNMRHTEEQGVAARRGRQWSESRRFPWTPQLGHDALVFPVRGRKAVLHPSISG